MKFFYLSYSGYKCYVVCPKKYEFVYIIKDKVYSDPKDSFFGSSIGKVMEWFYSQYLWTSSDPVDAALELIEPAMDAAFADKHWDRNIDPVFVNMLRGEMRESIPHALEIVRKNRLLSSTSRAEVDLSVNYYSPSENMTIRMGGRADFIHGQDTDIWIIDGKASKHREKYADSDQLIWYATQHFIKYHVAPSRLGFIYYKFPEDPIQWIAYDSQAIRDGINRTFDVAKKIKLEMFQPSPSTACNICNYRTKCDEGSRFVAEHKVATGGRITESIFSLEPAG